MKKKMFSVVLALCMAASAVSVYAFEDCQSEAVDTLTELKVLAGYEDGTFRPDANITRAEFAKVISSVTGYKKTDEIADVKSAFSDVAENHWALGYITYCKETELFDGYEDGTFKPNDNISFAEAVKVCLSAVGHNNVITAESDIWYEPWVDSAYAYKLFDDKDKNPTDNITRLEVAEMLSRIINLPLCIASGFDAENPRFIFADGSVDENGVEVPLRTLMTTYLQ